MEQTKNQNSEKMTNDSRQIVANRVRNIMQQRGLKLANLASLCELPSSNLSSIINGKRNPTLDTLDRLADALDVPTWQLLCTPGESDSDANKLPFNDDNMQQQERPAGRTEMPTDAPEVADLITIDPYTGEAHRYRLIS